MQIQEDEYILKKESEGSNIDIKVIKLLQLRLQTLLHQKELHKESHFRI